MFDDGVQYEASKARIRATLSATVEEVGGRVEARYSDGCWYDARIVSLPGIDIEINWMCNIILKMCWTVLIFAFLYNIF